MTIHTYLMLVIRRTNDAWYYKDN